MPELGSADRAGVQTRPPLVLRWGGPDRPLPVQVVRGVGRRAADIPGLGPPPWLDTGPAGRPFDFTTHVRRLCADITRRCPALAHVQPARILFAFTQARNGRAHRLQARVTPLPL